MKKITPILNRLKEILNVRTDKELTEKIGISYSTLDTWKNRDKIPERRLLEFSSKYNISFDWLLTGEGEIYKKNNLMIGDNNVGVIGNNVNSNINISLHKKDVSNIEDEILESFRVLPPKKQEYYYHKLKAEALEEKLKEESN